MPKPPLGGRTVHQFHQDAGVKPRYNKQKTNISVLFLGPLFLPSCPLFHAGADELSAGKYSYLVCKTVGLMTTLRENFPSVLFSSIFISIGNLPGQSEN